MSVKRGLPSDVKMRHNIHYVDSLLFKEGEVIGRSISITKITPNPEQPRKELGNIQDLSDSIKEHGVLEPILVRKTDLNYQIISGERRYRAAKLAGIETMPCIVKNLDENEILEIALVENLQRKDLNPFEEADGLFMLFKKYRYTHEQIAKKISKSRSSVSETISLASLSPRVRDAAIQADITAKSMLLSVSKLNSEEEQLALISKIHRGASREDVRRQSKKQIRSKPFIFKFKDPGHSYSFNLKFKRSQVSKSELIDCLETILEQVRHSEN